MVLGLFLILQLYPSCFDSLPLFCLSLSISVEFLFSLSSHLPLFFLCCLFFFALRVGMRGLMQRVSPYLPALMRMCLFEWKAVRSCYAMRATSEDDLSAARGGWSVFRCEGQLPLRALYEESEDRKMCKEGKWSWRGIKCLNYLSTFVFIHSPFT